MFFFVELSFAVYYINPKFFFPLSINEVGHCIVILRQCSCLPPPSQCKSGTNANGVIFTRSIILHAITDYRSTSCRTVSGLHDEYRLFNS